MRRVWCGLFAAALAVTALVHSAEPASACSCAGVTDTSAFIDGAQAVFVGRLTDKRTSGLGDFGEEAIYVFEVEEWIKGDLGSVIEVHSAANGAACGLEFWYDGNRTGASVRLDAGNITSDLCSQVDPDVLLAAAHPQKPDSSLLPSLLVGGPGTTALTLLDSDGRLVGHLDAGSDLDYAGTSDLSLCPGGRFLAQQIPNAVVVWDLDAYTLAGTYDLAPLGDQMSYFDISCRNADATSIWILGAQGEYPTGDQILELVPEPQLLMELPWGFGQLGGTHAIVTDEPQTSVIRFDYETGDVLTLVDVPQDQLVSAYAAPNPVNHTSAVEEVVYHDDGEPTTTVKLIDRTGRILATYPITGEGGWSVGWLDEGRFALTSYQYHLVGPATSMLSVIDTRTGDVNVTPGWAASAMTGAADRVYGTAGGTIQLADLGTGDVVDVTTLPNQSVEQLVMVSGLRAPQGLVTPPEPPPAVTVPPLLMEPAVTSSSRTGAQIIWWLVLTGSVISAVTLMVRRRRPSGQGNQVQ